MSLTMFLNTVPLSHFPYKSQGAILHGLVTFSNMCCNRMTRITSGHFKYKEGTKQQTGQRMIGSCSSHQKGKQASWKRGCWSWHPTGMRPHQVNIQKDEHPRNKETRTNFWGPMRTEQHKHPDTRFYKEPITGIGK